MKYRTLNRKKHTHTQRLWMDVSEKYHIYIYIYNSRKKGVYEHYIVTIDTTASRTSLDWAVQQQA